MELSKGAFLLILMVVSPGNMFAQMSLDMDPDSARKAINNFFEAKRNLFLILMKLAENRDTGQMSQFQQNKFLVKSFGKKVERESFTKTAQNEVTIVFSVKDKISAGEARLTQVYRLQGDTIYFSFTLEGSQSGTPVAVRSVQTVVKGKEYFSESTSSDTTKKRMFTQISVEENQVFFHTSEFGDVRQTFLRFKTEASAIALIAKIN